MNMRSNEQPHNCHLIFAEDNSSIQVIGHLVRDFCNQNSWTTAIV
jgi:hypothetical protein